MHRAMMPATEWDRELIADLAAERTGLSESEMMGIRGLAAADEARLLGDIAKVLSVAIPTRGRDSEDALINALRLTRVGALVAVSWGLRQRRKIVRGCGCIGRWKL
jgi:hypothetical protein